MVLESLVERRKFLSTALVTGLMYCVEKQTYIQAHETYEKPERNLSQRNKSKKTCMRNTADYVDNPPVPPPLDDSPESRRYDEFMRDKYKNYPSLSYGEKI